MLHAQRFNRWDVRGYLGRETRGLSILAVYLLPRRWLRRMKPSRQGIVILLGTIDLYCAGDCPDEDDLSDLKSRIKG